MNAKWILITVALVGCLLMISGWALAGFSFENLFADKAVYTQISKTETLQAYDTVEIKTDVERIIISPSDDEAAHLSYFDSDKRKHAYSYDGGVLSLGIDDSNRKWYDYISFNFALNERVIEVRLPRSFKGKLSVREATGAVEVKNLAGLSSIDLSLTTGDLSVSACEASDARLTTTTGRLGVSGFSGKALYAESTTGAILLDGVSGCAIISRFATGSVALSDTSCDTIDVSGTTGNIKLDGVTANGITLRSTTGSISGSIAGGAKEFSIDSATSTGNNNLKNVDYGGARKLSAHSATGNIHITFDE